MSDLLITHARIASMQSTERPYGELTDTDIRIQHGVITELGCDLEPENNETVIDAAGRWCLPGFVDCHTHLVYGGDRSNEFALRLEGVSYQQISEQGGGIKSTVRATRTADDTTLYKASLRRLKRLAEEGVTTVEIKSGYGLDKDTELRQLAVADKLAKETGLSIVKTYLGAHALPPDTTMDADEYIDFVCQTMLPYIAEHKLAQAVDVFCENVGFTLAQTERVFTAASHAGLCVKGHVEQLSDSKGAALAARFNALSVDHIEYLADSDVPLLAQSGTVAVLLPGAFYYLKETMRPPVAALRKHAVPMAVATDLNPGTSPVASLLTCANMACVLFGLTTEEALRGITVNAAKALGLTDRGEIRAGMRADITLWDIPGPQALVYEMNGFRPDYIIAGGHHVA
ncbi:imidazolonepropionase [Alteromonas lipolytica]